jgi:predicted anti-sigma-YlaC factor YlaD
MKEQAMDCKQAQDSILLSAGGGAGAAHGAAQGAALEAHLSACAECARAAQAVGQSMALLEEWQAPEPSPYFEVRLRARLREEAARPALSWWQWMRKPAAGVAMAALVAAAVGLFSVSGDLSGPRATVAVERPAERVLPYHFDSDPGSAVADLLALERNHELFAHFDLLDEMDLFDNGDREF